MLFGKGGEVREGQWRSRRVVWFGKDSSARGHDGAGQDRVTAVGSGVVAFQQRVLAFQRRLLA